MNKTIKALKMALNLLDSSHGIDIKLRKVD